MIWTKLCWSAQSWVCRPENGGVAQHQEGDSVSKRRTKKVRSIHSTSNHSVGHSMQSGAAAASGRGGSLQQLSCNSAPRTFTWSLLRKPSVSAFRLMSSPLLLMDRSGQEGTTGASAMRQGSWLGATAPKRVPPSSQLIPVFRKQTIIL